MKLCVVLYDEIDAKGRSEAFSQRRYFKMP